MIAGNDNNKDNSKDLFCILLAWSIFLFLINLLNTGNDTVLTAIPAIARLI